MRVLLTVLFFVMLLPTDHAQAGHFVWKDPGTRVQFSVPDTWRRVRSWHTDDLVTFAAPGQNQHAQCLLRSYEDRRFSIFPEHVSDHVVRQNFGFAFWERLGSTEFRHFRVNDVQFGQGIGNGFASFADVSYIPQHAPKHMRAYMYASLYNNRVYILSCASEAHSFLNWYETFRYVVGSIRARREIHELPSGHYRYFPGDPVLGVIAPYGQSSNH